MIKFALKNAFLHLKEIKLYLKTLFFFYLFGELSAIFIKFNNVIY